MRRQLAVLSGLWFVVFCAVTGALNFLLGAFRILFEELGGSLPLPTLIVVGGPSDLRFESYVVAVAVVACVNAALLGIAYRQRDERAARIFHRWALGIQAIALLLFVCSAAIALSLPFLKLAPVL